jgi:hypothetical protein
MSVSSIPFKREYNENDVIETKEGGMISQGKVSKGKERGKEWGMGWVKDGGFSELDRNQSSIDLWVANNVKTRMEQV